MVSGAKILVVRFSSIGDIVLTTPVLRCLKNQSADNQVHYLVKEAYKDILLANPNVDKVWSFNRSLNEVIPELKVEKFDYIIDLHNNLRSRRIAATLRRPVSRLEKQNINKWLLVNFGVDRLPNVHIVDRYFKAASRFAVVKDGEGLDFFYPENFSIRKGLILEKPYLVAVVGGQHEGKKLPLGKWVELCNSVNQRVIVVGGQEDVEFAAELEKKCSNVLSFAGRATLFESAKIVEESTLVITNDTGMMHIAAAFKKPIISLWGQTTPRFGMYPYKPDPRSVIIEPNPKKRKLSKLGNRPVKPPVMDRIQVSDILEAIGVILS